jgi:hypothetical protein
VGLSINLDLIRREENVGFSALASQSFIHFLFMLFIAITFLIPEQSPLGVGLPLLWMGGFGVWTNARLLTKTLRGRKRKLMLGLIVWRFALPLAAFLGMIVIAVSILQGADSLLYWLIAPIIILLSTAVRNTWDLLVRVGESKDHS